MPCRHRFINDINPLGQLKYLFVGTFNPSWDRPQGDDANWFYGRQYNDFWFIMPQVFGLDNLMPQEFRTNRNFLMNPKNGLKIVPYKNAHSNRNVDRELYKLTLYLKKISELEDLSDLDHKYWEKHILDNDKI